MKYLKKYNNFINESLVYQNYIWELNKNDIKEYFYDLSDIGYMINIDFGFYDNNYYKDRPIEGENIPCYIITIVSPSFNNSSFNNKSENLTDSVLFAIDIMNKYANSTAILTREIDEIEELELNNLKIEKGIYYGNIKLNCIYLCFICKDPVKINQIQLASIYDWKDAIIKDNSIWAKIDIIDLADMLISNNSKHYKNLLKSWEYVYDNFFYDDYVPDINYMLSDLYDDNIVLLIKVLIKKFGIKKFKYNNEEDCVNYYMKNSYELCKLIEELKKIDTSDDNPIINILDIISNYRMDAHIEENKKDLIKDFDRIVKKDFIFYKETVMEDEEVTYYYLKFNNNWLYSNYNDNDVCFYTINDALNNYFDNNYFNYELNPNWSDYGDYDLNLSNKEIKLLLEYDLKN